MRIEPYSIAIQKQLQRIERLMITGDFKKGLELIEKNLKGKDINEDDQLRLLNFKGYIQNKLGNYKEAFEIAENILKRKSEDKNSLIYLDALSLKALHLFYLIRLNNRFY